VCFLFPLYFPFRWLFWFPRRVPPAHRFVISFSLVNSPSRSPLFASRLTGTLLCLFPCLLLWWLFVSSQPFPIVWATLGPSLLFYLAFPVFVSTVLSLFVLPFSSRLRFPARLFNVCSLCVFLLSSSRRRLVVFPLSLSLRSFLGLFFIVRVVFSSRMPYVN